MNLTDFHFDLPEHLIAKYPTQDRTASRLLRLDGNTGTVAHKAFTDCLNFIEKGDLLVFNNTKVIPARLLGKKETGGQVEVLVERITGMHTCIAHVKASKSPKPGSRLILEEAVHVLVTGRKDALFELEFTEDSSVLALLETYGHMPLPPYIDRPDEEADKDRYQTVYSKEPGAVAAPTAGLHFDDEILQQLQQKGVEFAFLTLHVGAGTFTPVRVDDITTHKMHAEFADVPQDVIDKILATKRCGKRVIAVGTTSVRSLETAAKHAGEALIAPYCDDTNIFIYPGFTFKVVDAMFTNFHLPESTLMMLISAFGGYQNVMNAYQEAIKEAYRFFSYGDSMFISRQSVQEGFAE